MLVGGQFGGGKPGFFPGPPGRPGPWTPVRPGQALRLHFLLTISYIITIRYY